MAINYDATIFAPNINARIFLDRIFLAYIGLVNLCCVLFSRASFFLHVFACFRRDGS